MWLHLLKQWRKSDPIGDSAPQRLKPQADGTDGVIMTPARRPTPAHNEAGFALIEVLISGLIAVVVAAAVMALFATTERSAADQRHRSQAYGVAQEDQARMRGMKVPSLYKYSLPNNPVVVDGVTYSVTSTGKYINDVTGDDLTCGSGSATVDYVKITSKVTWPGMRSGEEVVIQSLIAPPNGTLNPNAGTLSIVASNANGAALPPVGLSATGPATISGTTSAAGCAIFVEQPAGEYTLTISNVGAGLVDPDGNAPNSPAARKIKVTPEVTNTVNLLYDTPGKVPIEFKTRNYNPSLSASSASSFIAFNVGMSTAKLFGAAEGTPFATKTAEPLFPFTSADVFYAGACTTNDPQSGTARATLVVPRGPTAAPTQTIVLPSLWLTVKTDGVVANGAPVKITDTECETGSPSHDITRSYTTNSSGQLANPGLPWSTYNICASGTVETGTEKNKGQTIILYGTVHETNENFVVHDVNGTTDEILLTKEDPSGACP
jgi:Tfp pilus assembly protein PilV